MPAYLVRHAHAGSRARWQGDDDRRPLSPKGRSQAEGLAAWLDGTPVDELHSSPSARCIETLQPLADRNGLEVGVDGRLAEGSDIDGCLELVLRGEGRTVALCTHGDVIPKVLRHLRSAGLRSADGDLSQKGSAWVLRVVDGRVVAADYQPPLGR